MAAKLDEAYSYLDVAGYNYADARYAVDGERMPNRVIVGTETHNTNIAQNWPKVLALPHVIGDFTWTGWDYLGEVGLGRVAYGEDHGLLMGEYPWLASWCADIDITGHRRTLSYLREIVFGLRPDPHVSVRDPAVHGLTPTHRGAHRREVARGPGLVVVARLRRSPDHRRRAERRRRSGAPRQRHVDRTSAGRRGEPLPREVRHHLRAGRDRGVAYRDGHEVGRTALQSGTGLAAIDVRVDRTEIRADDTDLAYVDIELVDAEGRLHHTEDRAVTVEVDGPAVLQGLGSANPSTEESFVTPTHDTFLGRALAVVRPTGPDRSPSP